MKTAMTYLEELGWSQEQEQEEEEEEEDCKDDDVEPFTEQDKADLLRAVEGADFERVKVRPFDDSARRGRRRKSKTRPDVESM
tara:strand:+ start:477 stop:725 length:249 start_codon:yes stop_codon:yes gene_type:complete